MQNSNNRVDTVFVLMIFCVFAISVLIVLMLSASTYGNMTDISGEGRNERIVLSYIRTKIRNFDTAGNIYVSEFGGLSALSLEEEINGRSFVTYIFYYNGWVRELFHERGLVFTPADGAQIIRANSLYFETLDNNMIRVNTYFGNTTIFLRSFSESEGY